MRYNKLIIVISFIFLVNLHSQNLSDETKWKLIEKINDNTPDYIIDSLRAFKVVEAIPKVQNFFWAQDEFNRGHFIELLFDLGDPSILSLIHSYLDSVSVNRANQTSRFYRDFSSLMIAFNIMFRLSDYSNADLFIDFLDNIEKMKNVVPILKPLELLANNSFYKQTIKPYYEKIILKPISPSIKDLFIRKYYQYYSDSTFSLAKNIVLSDTSVEVRHAMIMMLKQMNYKYIVPYLKSIVVNETDHFIKDMILYQLLHIYQSPSNLLFINNIYEQLEPKFKESLDNSGYLESRLNTPTIKNVVTLLDSLMSYTEQCSNLNWLRDNSYRSELLPRVQTAINYLNSSDSLNCYKQIKLYQNSISQVYSDSAGSYPKYVSKDAYKFLYYYPKYILERLPSPPTVKLEDSQGNLLRGGSLQYYEGGWKNAVDNRDGTYMLDTKLKTISLRMTYEYGSQTKSYIMISKDTIVFQTVNAEVKLFNSKGSPIDTGTVQYYAGGWRNFGKTINGVASKELLPVNYSFRVTYGYSSNDKAQNLESNSMVEFTTVETKVELRNSLGELIDHGAVQYYAGGWRSFGTTEGGVASKELLPNNYSFRMTYAYGSNDKQQNISVNPIVVFSTARARVELRNSQGNLIDGGTVQYYSGGGREFGITVGGIITKELLPNNYSFRMSYSYASNDKQQDIGDNLTVVFQTINTLVELRNSQGNLMDGGVVQYYSGGWHSFGTTSTGMSSKELLPNNYSFRMTHEYLSIDKSQNTGTSPTVTFTTIQSKVVVRNNQNLPINNALVRYYTGGWRNFGTTVNGEAVKELLPVNITFRAIVGTAQQDKVQNLQANPVVEFVF